MQYTNVTDRQTDGQTTPGDSKDCAYAQRRVVKLSFGPKYDDVRVNLAT